jgi:hypothetical protein
MLLRSAPFFLDIAKALLRPRMLHLQEKFRVKLVCVSRTNHTCSPVTDYNSGVIDRKVTPHVA